MRMRTAGAALALVALLGVAGCTAAPASSGTSSPASSTAGGSATTASTEPATPSAPAPDTTSSPTVATTVSSNSGASAPAPTVGAEPTDASTVPVELIVPAAADEPTTTGPAPDAGFSGTVAAIDPAQAARMASSWREGCPVPLSDLRYLTLTYRGFDGADHQGELVVAASVADQIVAVFRRLYEIGYPIASMRLVDDFGGDDDASMSANNTSAFNCRPVTGGGGFSEHSYGTAVDVNPVQNPYLNGSTVLPAQGRQYVDRPDAPGVIHTGDEVVQAFADQGLHWGGAWSGPIDYQHFSVSGR